jgi:hypothetical protein
VIPTKSIKELLFEKFLISLNYLFNYIFSIIF